jgi:hypothetical protein
MTRDMALTVIMVSLHSRSLLSCGVAADLHPSVNEGRDQSIMDKFSRLLQSSVFVKYSSEVETRVATKINKYSRWHRFLERD